MEIKGRDLMEGVPKSVTISDEEIREALDECINIIINSIRVVLERTPPELSADIADKGIVLAGGGALIKNPGQTNSGRNRIACHLSGESFVLPSSLVPGRC
jgi:actin-like ATPase involved in cell morphogenesis